MYWCCPSTPCMVFLDCVHLALLFALSLSPGNSLVSWWCDHSMLASLLWQCQTVRSLLQLCGEPTHLFSLLSMKPTVPFSAISYQMRQDMFLHSFWLSSFHSHMLLHATLALLISLTFIEIAMLWLFHILCSDAPFDFHPFNLVRNSVIDSPSSVVRDPRYGNISSCSSCSFWMSMWHTMLSLAITLMLTRIKPSTGLILSSSTTELLKQKQHCFHCISSLMLLPTQLPYTPPWNKIKTLVLLGII